MEETVKKPSTSPDPNQKVECIKCHNQVPANNGIQAKDGFVCNDCVVKQKKRQRNVIWMACAAVIVIAAACVAICLSTDGNRTGQGFEGVGQINDDMKVSVDSAAVAFDMSGVTAVSTPVTTQAPISDLAEFKNVIKRNIAKAQQDNSNDLDIPAVGVMFELNTNQLVAGGEDLARELANTYLKTNQKAKILVEGYTCDLGSERVNDALSKARAEAIVKLLTDMGVAPDKIEAKWYGKSRYQEFNYPNKSDYRRVILSIR
ncbi:MAG: OmpA family protein [Bacteroidales bacterium]|nr:OmpA family protein [Bacteroidales bacterium]